MEEHSIHDQADRPPESHLCPDRPIGRKAFDVPGLGVHHSESVALAQTEALCDQNHRKSWIREAVCWDGLGMARKVLTH